MLAINEVKEAERIIETNKYDKISTAASLIIRYYIQIKGLSPAETKDKMKAFFNMNHKDYDNWRKFVSKVIKTSDDYPLCNIDEIPITQKEINIVDALETDIKKKVMFTFIVMGKLKQIKSGNSWLNDSSKSLFDRANVNVRVADRDYIIKDLYELEYISYAKSPMNLSLHIDAIDMSGDPVFTVKDLRNIGFAWLKYKGESYTYCNECGILFKPTRPNNIYCKNCVGYIPLQTKVIECCDCGTSFETPSMTKSKRCPHCRHKHYNERLRNYMRNK